MAKKRTKGFSCQNKKANKPLKASESMVNNAVKQAREETVYSQSSEIGKSLALEMRVVCRGLNTSEPVEFKISFPRHLMYAMPRKQLSQMTGISPADR